MKLLCKALLLFALLSVMPRIARAQVQTGTPPFGSFAGGPIDTINLQNIDVHLRIPILHKAGRGLPFDMDLLYDGLIWQPGGTWQSSLDWERTGGAPTTLTNSGWFFQPLGYVTLSGAIQQWCADQYGNYSGVMILMTFSYTDGERTSHSFPGYVMYAEGACGNSFPTWAGTADDGSGISLTVAYDPNNGASATVTDRHGRRIYFEPNPNSNGDVWSPVQTDTNGNQISFSQTAGTSASVTDTLGKSMTMTGSGTPSSPVVLGYTDPNGNPAAYTVKYTSMTVKTNFGCSGIAEYGPTTWNLISEIDLPNGTKYTFTYEATPGFSGDVTARLASVTLPTGGTISYVYGGGFSGTGVRCGTDTQPTWVHRYTPDTGSSYWTYAATPAPYPSFNSYTTVTDPAGNATVVNFQMFSDQVLNPNEMHTYEIERQIYQGPATGTPLQTVYTCYNGAAPPCTSMPNPPNVTQRSIFRIWANGQESEANTVYDREGPDLWGNYFSFGLVKEVDEYDYGNGAPSSLPIRKTLTSYATLGNGILDRPSQVSVYDGSSNLKAQTTYGYDESTPLSTGITTQHVSVSGSRGNQTSISSWLSGSTTATTNCNISVSNGNIVSYAVYNDTGTVDHAVDACGQSANDSNHRTSYVYSGTYAGAFPTTITNPLNQAAMKTYDVNTGLLTSVTDPNGQTTSYAYDSMLRLTQSSYPDGGQSTITRQEASFPFSATVTKKITSSVSYVSTDTVDGLGRVTRSQTTDPQGTVYADTTYDAVGRKATASNPYRSTSDSTYGVTTYAYDPLSRPTSVTKPDGSVTTTQYCVNATLVTDEAGHWRRSTTDGLGRLIEVDEPNSTSATVNVCPGSGEPIWATTYAYDALDDLTTVVQGGSRNRSFTYDSLKHLTSSTNPEPGTVTYAYDANGNLITKTDARGVAITYSYERLNRLTGRTYSNGDPGVTYTYDEAACLGLTACYNLGQRTSMTDAAGSEHMAYDKMGREWTEQRTTNSVTKTTGYTYNLDGSLATLTYPSGRVTTYTPDSAGRPSVAQDVANGITYASGTCANGSANNGVCYASSGGLAQVQNGANLVSTYIYNNRLQPCWIYATTGTALATTTACTGTATAGNILDLKYNFSLGSGDNGNVMGIANNRDATRTQSFTYDQLNRIVTAQTAATTGANCWGEAFSYDQWANLLSIGVSSTAYNGCTQENLGISVGTNNRISTGGFTYDLAGNNLTDGANTYAWNAESEMKSAAGVNYTYDGDGNRMQKSNGKIYWYGAGSEILDESDASGNITDEYVFFGGKRIARWDLTTAHSALPGTGTATVSGSEQSIGGTPATAGSGSVAFSGTLQSKQVQTQAAAPGTGSVTISGSEQVMYVPEQCYYLPPPYGYYCIPGYYVYDYGTVSVTVNGVTMSASYGANGAAWSGTSATIASALASAINGTSNSPVTATVSSSTVTLTAKTQGSATNYPLSTSVSWASTAFALPSFTATPSGSTLTGGSNAVYTTVYDSGTSTITVNGHSDTVGWSGSGTTTSSIASALASSINADSGASVTAAASSGTVNLTARTMGASTNYSLSSSSTYDSSNFSTPSFTSNNSGSTLTGGTNAGSITYDSGNVWVTISGTQYSASYGQGSTANSVASALASAINGSGTAVVTASVSGSTIALTSKLAGANTNYSLSSGSVTTQGSFSSPSFTTSTSGAALTGGTDAGNGNIYYYVEDMLGSSRTIVQAGQTSPCYDADFYPFGGERDITISCSQNYKFEGKERDTETGNDDFGARYYSSRLGRWLSADWSAVPAPVPYANLANPQTLNLYAMVSDNPETFADLDGHEYTQDGIRIGTGNVTLDTLMAFNSLGSDGQLHQDHDPPQQQNQTQDSSSQTQQQQQQQAGQPQPAQTQAATQSQGYWEYSQSTGAVTAVHSDGIAVVAGIGYSGIGTGYNNPAAQGQQNVGPIPQGTYTIGPQQNINTREGHKLTGAMPLTPAAGTNTFGRGGFIIHGDNNAHNRTASNGCPILGPAIRNLIGGSGVNTLVVVP